MIHILGPLPHTWTVAVEFLAPGFNLLQFLLLQVFESNPEDRLDRQTDLSLSHLNKFKNKMKSIYISNLYTL